MAYNKRDEYYTSFEKHYHCYSLSHVAKPQHEPGDKIIMPQSAFDRLAHTEVGYPMMFELCNLSSGKTTHCGVVEFTADEGFIYLPNWMMDNMKLQEYELVRVTNVSLAKATYMKLQPHTKGFLDELSNPRAVLEAILRKFSCLTTGDTIMIMHNESKYYIDVLETKPSNAVSITETDCEVDFAPPLDYKEPDEKLVKRKVPFPSQVEEQSKQQPQAVKEEANNKFKAFTGKGKLLGLK